jgi:hypothetical protein
MNDYKKMYYTLFNKLTDIIYQLQMVQRQAEEMCPSQEPEAEAAPPPDDPTE